MPSINDFISDSNITDDDKVLGTSLGQTVNFEVKNLSNYISDQLSNDIPDGYPITVKDGRIVPLSIRQNIDAEVYQSTGTSDRDAIYLIGQGISLGPAGQVSNFEVGDIIVVTNIVRGTRYISEITSVQLPLLGLKESTTSKLPILGREGDRNNRLEHFKVDDITISGDLKVTGNIDVGSLVATPAFGDSENEVALWAEGNNTTIQIPAELLNNAPGGLDESALAAYLADNDYTTGPHFDGVYSSLSGRPQLGTAAATNANDYATAAQGLKADSALQTLPEITEDNLNSTINASLDKADSALQVGDVRSNSQNDTRYIEDDTNTQVNGQVVTIKGTSVTVPTSLGGLQDSRIPSSTTIGNYARFDGTDGGLEDITPSAVLNDIGQDFVNVVDSSQSTITLTGANTVTAATFDTGAGGAGEGEWYWRESQGTNAVVNPTAWSDLTAGNQILIDTPTSDDATTEAIQASANLGNNIFVTTDTGAAEISISSTSGTPSNDYRFTIGSIVSFFGTPGFSGSITISDAGTSVLLKESTFSGIVDFSSSTVLGIEMGMEIADGSITETQLSTSVNASLDKADSALQSITNGSVSETQLSTSVNASLDKADSALQSITNGSIGETQLSTSVNASLDKADSALQSIANGSITETQLSTSVNASLDKADSALQSITNGSISETQLSTSVNASLDKADNALPATYATDATSTFAGSAATIDVAVSGNNNYNFLLTTSQGNDRAVASQSRNQLEWDGTNDVLSATNITVDTTLTLGTTAITASGDEINQLDGVDLATAVSNANSALQSTTGVTLDTEQTITGNKTFNNRSTNINGLLVNNPLSGFAPSGDNLVTLTTYDSGGGSANNGQWYWRTAQGTNTSVNPDSWGDLGTGNQIFFDTTDDADSNALLAALSDGDFVYIQTNTGSAEIEISGTVSGGSGDRRITIESIVRSFGTPGFSGGMTMSNEREDLFETPVVDFTATEVTGLDTGGGVSDYDDLTDTPIRREVHEVRIPITGTRTNIVSGGSDEVSRIFLRDDFNAGTGTPASYSYDPDTANVVYTHEVTGSFSSGANTNTALTQLGTAIAASHSSITWDGVINTSEAADFVTVSLGAVRGPAPLSIGTSSYGPMGGAFGFDIRDDQAGTTPYEWTIGDAWDTLEGKYLIASPNSSTQYDSIVAGGFVEISWANNQRGTYLVTSTHDTTSFGKVWLLGALLRSTGLLPEYNPSTSTGIVLSSGGGDVVNISAVYNSSHIDIDLGTGSNIESSFTITANNGLNVDETVINFDPVSGGGVHSTITVTDYAGMEITSFTNSSDSPGDNTTTEVGTQIVNAINLNTETPLDFTATYEDVTNTVVLTSEAGVYEGNWSVTVNNGAADASAIGNLGIGTITDSSAEVNEINTISISGAKTGTKAAPPTGLRIGEIWMDTTDDSVQPLLRISTVNT